MAFRGRAVGRTPPPRQSRVASAGLRSQKSTGKVWRDEVYEAGRYGIGPDYTFRCYPLNVQNFNERLSVWSKSSGSDAGSTVYLDVSYQYLLKPEKLGELYSMVALNFEGLRRRLALRCASCKAPDRPSYGTLLPTCGLGAPPLERSEQQPQADAHVLAAAQLDRQLVVHAARPHLELLGRLVNNLFEGAAAVLGPRLVHEDEVHLERKASFDLLVQRRRRLARGVRARVEVDEEVLRRGHRAGIGGAHHSDARTLGSCIEAGYSTRKAQAHTQSA